MNNADIIIYDYSYISGVYIFLAGCLMFTWDSISTNKKNQEW